MRRAAGLLFLVLAQATGTGAFLLPSPASHTHTHTRLHASSGTKEPLSWQESLELLISPTTSLAQRQVLFQAVVSRAPEIRKDVEEAIREGSVDGLLTDGVKAVRRQLQEDIIPQLASEPEQAAKMLLEEIPKLAQRSLESLPKNPKDLAESLREISTSLPSEARNVFLKTPEGLETPSFRLLYQSPDDSPTKYEIREYDSYTVAYTEMPTNEKEGPVLGSPTSTGGAFNTLASYIFGYNDQKSTLAMTTPVEIRKDTHTRRGDREAFSMRFPIGQKYTTESAPRPSDAKVRLTTTPPKDRVAVKEFPGFATEGEVQRQLISLLSALDREGVEVVGGGESYRILQYNPPYTLPWLRRNELCVEVKGVPMEGGGMGEVVSSVVEVVVEEEGGEYEDDGTPSD